MTPDARTVVEIQKGATGHPLDLFGHGDGRDSRSRVRDHSRRKGMHEQ
jgi:hypothetical protein